MFYVHKDLYVTYKHKRILNPFKSFKEFDLFLEIKTSELTTVCIDGTKGREVLRILTGDQPYIDGLVYERPQYYEKL